MTDWFETLPGLYRQVWHQLVKGTDDRSAATRHPTLATISPGGWPEARTVVLRSADPDAGLLDVYTDTQSDKIASLSANPHAALHIWAPDLDLQVRLQAKVAILTGAEVAPRWEALPAAARLSYGVQPSPGMQIAAALDYAKHADQSRFCVLRLAVTHLDVVHLGCDHRRAAFAAADDWTGKWLAP